MYSVYGVSLEIFVRNFLIHTENEDDFPWSFMGIYHKITDKGRIFLEL